jgi:translation initiation factor 1
MSRKVPPAAPSTPFNTPFAGLAGLRAALPDPPPGAPPPPAAPAPAPSLGAKLVVTRERKGHGGKAMVRVAGLALGPEALEALAGRLKRALGCGARVDGGDVLVQGDQAERVADWLREAGAKRVILGN